MVRPRRRAAPARCAAALPPLRRAGRRLRRARRRVLGRRRPCLLLLVPVVQLDRHDRPGPAPPRARGGRLGFGRGGPRSGRSRSRARRHLRRHPGRLAGLAPPEPPGETARAPVDRLEEISGLLAEVACGTVARGVDPADATGGGGVHALQFEDTGHLTSAAARRGREAAGASIQPQVKAVMAEQATWPAAAPARTWRRVGAGWEDRPMTTLGAVFLPQLPPERLRGVARLADESGLEELWLWEDCFRESGVAAAAAALAWTERVRVGVGHGVQDWMRQVGAGVDSPITLLREYVVALRALLRGEEVTTDGAYLRLDKVALDWPPQPAPALLAGAVGPRSLRLCGELADGTILTGGTTEDGVREARRLVEEGRRAAGRDRVQPLTVYLLAATGPEARQRLHAEVRSFGGDPAEVGVAGDAEAVADAVRRWAEAGADSVILQPTADDPDPEGFIRFVALQVRRLVP